MQNKVHFISFLDTSFLFFFMALSECPIMTLPLPGVGLVHLLDVRGIETTLDPHFGALTAWCRLNKSADNHGIDGVVGKFKGCRVGDVSISGPGGWEVRGHAVPCTDVIIDLCFVNTNRDDVRVLEPEKACTIYLMDPLRFALRGSCQDTANIMYRDGFMYEKFGCTGAGSRARL